MSVHQLYSTVYRSFKYCNKIHFAAADAAAGSRIVGWIAEAGSPLWSLLKLKSKKSAVHVTTKISPSSLDLVLHNTPDFIVRSPNNCTIYGPDLKQPSQPVCKTCRQTKIGAVRKMDNNAGISYLYIVRTINHFSRSKSVFLLYAVFDKSILLRALQWSPIISFGDQPLLLKEKHWSPLRTPQRSPHGPRGCPNCGWSI